MKRLVGVLVAVIGGLSLAVGIPGTLFLVLSNAMTYEGSPHSNAPIAIGLLVVLSGFILCCISLGLLLSTGRKNLSGPYPARHTCSNCRCQVTDGSKTCEHCGADFK